MTASPRFRSKQATDVWSTRERLCLASSVLRSGDQNWVSVSRAIKPFGEASRPPDWFSQKNCALQYAELLEKVDAPKRKRGERSDATDTPGDLIVRKLTMDRIEELKKVVYEEQQRHKKLKRELEMVRSGQLDEKLEDLLRGIQDEIRAKEIADNEHQKWLQEREQKVAAMKVATSKGLYPLPPKSKRAGSSYNLTRAEELRRSSYQSDNSEPDNNIESPLSEPLSIEVDETANPVLHSNTLVLENIISQQAIKTSPRHTGLTVTSSSTSPLLTSLLKSPSPATTPTTVTTIQSSPKAPILGSALQGSSPSKHAESLTTGLTQRPSQVVPSFFNPSSALASAAARQLAVATAAPSTISSSNSILASGFTVTSADTGSSSTSSILGGISLSRPQLHQHGSSHINQSATSSAPTLSRLLEMPPSIPGKLPPLPVVEIPVISSINDAQVSTSEISRTIEPIASQPTSSNFISNVKIDSASNWDSAILALQEVTASAKNESDLSQIEAQVASLVEGVCEVEEAFRDELGHGDTGLEVDMEAIVNEIMKEEIQVVTPEDSPEAPPDISDMANLQSSDILEVEDGGTVEVIHQEEQPEISHKEEEPTVSDSVSIELKSSEVVSGESSVNESKEIVPDIILPSSPSGPVSIEQKVSESTSILIQPKTKTLSTNKDIETTDTATVDPKDSNLKIAEAMPPETTDSLENVSAYNLGDLATVEVVITDKDVVEGSEEEKDDKQEKLKLTKDLSSTSVDIAEQDITIEIKNEQSDESSEVIALTPATASTSREASEPREEECKLEIQDPTLQQLEDDESLNLNDEKPKAPSSVSDSIPNSPVSTPQSSDDQENLKEYKIWKKAIMLVWRAVANHKYANVFLHPVTNDVAPGYHSIVYRPRDLTAIKKNIEMGVIRTTIEFQRDVMLMFQNAIMYNSSDHDVFHMALEMQKEVMDVIQLMVQTTEAKVLRGRDGRDKKVENLKMMDTDFKDDEGGKRKRTSTSESSDSRPKKRRRQED